MCYITCRVFPILGFVFGFVSDDVDVNLTVLYRVVHRHRKSYVGSYKIYYSTVDSMVHYETKTGLTKSSTAFPPNASCVLLHLHRDLQFIVAFLRGMPSLKSHEKLSGIAAEAYDGTLAAYHGWTVRMGISAAMYTLPTKHELVVGMGLGMKNEGEIKNTLDQFCGKLKCVFDRVQAILTQYNALNLSQPPLEQYRSC